jgi:hypothetical protein
MWPASVRARRRRPQRTVEIGGAGRGRGNPGYGTGDILGEEALALLMPLHSRAQHR